MRRFLLTGALGTTLVLGVVRAESPPLQEALKALTAVQREGAGNTEAAKAWKVVGAAKPEAIPTILLEFDGATPTAINWLRSAIDPIVAREKAAGRKLEAASLIALLKDTKHNPVARRTAYDLLKADHAETAATLLPGFLNDPQPDLRRDAVEQKLKGLEMLSGAEKLVPAYKEALGFARDEDQISAIAKKLTELKSPVNITKHFGIITQWQISPSFPNKGGAGYEQAYPPETTTDRTGWKSVQSSDDMGNIDLNKAIEKKKELVAYASATVVVDADITCDVRAQSQNAVKIFVNGKGVLAREEYHHGAFLDQHTATVTLKKGRNEILIKVCQNDLAAPYADPWEFSCRIADSTGAAVTVKQSVTTDGKETLIETGELAPKTDVKKETK